MAATISPVLIGRMALSHVGARSIIESFDEESGEAKEINLWYDFARKQTLEAFDWNFARKRLALAGHDDDPPDNWLFRYQYPADCLVARHIVNPANQFTAISSTGRVWVTSHELQRQNDAIPFEIEQSNGTKSILTNLEEATLVYTFNLESTALFSNLFVEALSRCLAARVAFKLSGKQSVADKQFQIFYALIREAERSNGNERVDGPPRDAEWVRGRA